MNKQQKLYVFGFLLIILVIGGVSGYETETDKLEKCFIEKVESSTFIPNEGKYNVYAGIIDNCRVTKTAIEKPLTESEVKSMIELLD